MLLSAAIVFLPFLGFLISGICNISLGKGCISKDYVKKSLVYTPIFFMFTAFVSSLILFNCEDNVNYDLFNFISFRDEGHSVGNGLIGFWIVKGININFSIIVDNLTKIMFVVVTSVSFVVHIYSTEYMKKDPNIIKFMSYLSLFTFCMLVLASSGNLIQLFLGWESVGFCSYLLIGFWYEKNSAIKAADKAFIVNRVADFALVISLVIILKENNTLNLLEIHELSSASLLLLFIGCMGKSAQLFLHVWLPDAMEGPTPVSALIHAATMVTAGVFLLARLDIQPMIIISVIGALTCVFGATSAIAQNDIKKIIAYSTCSQLGYMFMAIGVGAHQNAIFHLFTHAFFKAMLFLSAGNVIHAIHEQDIFKISEISSKFKNGLKSQMPFTYMMFLFGSLAIIGIPPFSGYYSKDAILESVMLDPHYGKFLYSAGVATAFFTAMYSVKILIIVFHKRSVALSVSIQAQETKKDTCIHEAGAKELIPMSILLFGAMFSGIYGYYFLHISDPSSYLNSTNTFVYHAYHDHIPMLFGILGVVIGYIYYSSGINYTMSSKIGFFTQILYNGYYFDKIYEFALVKPTEKISKMFICLDCCLDHALVRVPSSLVRVFGNKTRKINSGYINSYAVVSALFVLGSTSYISYKIISLGFSL